jgi:hypothetical protein
MTQYTQEEIEKIAPRPPEPSGPTLAVSMKAKLMALGAFAVIAVCVVLARGSLDITGPEESRRRADKMEAESPAEALSYGSADPVRREGVGRQIQSDRSTFSIAIECGYVLLVIVILCLFWLLYFTPAIIATIRNHRHLTHIRILNLLLGWTVLGWLAMAIWACTGELKDRTG